MLPRGLCLLLLGLAGLTPSLAEQQLPLANCFRGQEKFAKITTQAQRENWAALPMGDRVLRCARSLEGTPYKGFTLEIHDHVESPSVNLLGLDCWTFFETALGMARMLETPRARYAPEDLLREIERTRYHGGVCRGNYLERIHDLAEWYIENDKRGVARDMTKKLGGVPFQGRRCTEMSDLWRGYRYLRNNPQLRVGMAEQERHLEKLPVRYIPKERVGQMVGQLRGGDIIGIATRKQGVYCSHVGLACPQADGLVHFMHASSDAGRVLVDVPLVDYLMRYEKHMGILVGRPLPAQKSR